jgi:nucleotide-binding universal stress UspA family protein
MSTRVPSMTRAALLRGVDLALHGTGTLGQDHAASGDTGPRGEFRVLLAIDPMTSCGDAERAMAQFAQVCRVRVDVVHVLKPGGLTREIWQRLRDTLAGALDGAVDHHIVEGVDPAATIATLCGNGDYDLLMAPLSSRHHWWPPWRRSLRAAIVRRSPVPVWTTGARHLDSLHRRQVQRVGCYLSLETGGDTHVRWAADFATRLGARLHLLHVVPPIDDGTIADALDSDRPLSADEAQSRLQTWIASGVDAATTVAVGTRRQEIRHMIQAEAIDLLCLTSEDALRGSRMSPRLRAVPCPVVCCP